jgi:hypothetical protein
MREEIMSSITEFATSPLPSAVLGEAHIGHINGALGTIRHGEDVHERGGPGDKHARPGRWTQLCTQRMCACADCRRTVIPCFAADSNR